MLFILGMAPVLCVALHQRPQPQEARYGATVPRSADVLVSRVMNNQEIISKIKTDPVEELQKIAKQVVRDLPRAAPLAWDKWIYRVVVFVLGVTVIAALIGAIALTFQSGDAKTPDVLTALGSAAVGALAGLLAPSPTSK